ncbi:hypothetical protein [Desulfitibacter alkalitolerans]|uniref:hypothetical protein n=1 Tax=Desulfitibacter alkalitolerans TaxID=264641 RepID=UPI0004889154|nr:hypothetical protein [Desulfitibacter alkalitolerans]
MKKLLKLIILAVLFMFFSSAAWAQLYSNVRQGTVEGYLLDRGSDFVLLEEYNGILYKLPVHEKAQLLIDNRPVLLADFLPGIEVYAQVRDGKVQFLEGYSTVNLGYIAPGSKVRTGIVARIDRDQIQVSLATGDQETYFASPVTLVQKKGVRVPLDVLYVGDRIKLYFDEAESRVASRIVIEGDSIRIKNIYKGTLNSSNRFSNSISLEDAQVFRNGSWQRHNNYMSLPYSVDIPLYIGGFKIPITNLSFYNGTTVYMVTRDFFNTERIDRMLLKNRHEAFYNGKIQDINWYTQAFELGNNKNFSFNDSTIVVKNERIVDMYSLSSQADAFVISDGFGDSRLASLVYILNEDINNSNMGSHHLYAGRLDMVVEDLVRINDFFVLNKNQWEGFDQEKELFYDNDTSLYNMEAREFISPAEFYSRPYSGNADKAKNWYAYIYTDGDRIASIGIMKNLDSLLRQRVTTGIIETIADDYHVGWTILLRNASDWSNRHESWVPKNTSVRVNLEESLVIREGKIIAPEDLRTGDRLYMVRDDFRGRVVIVK